MKGEFTLIIIKHSPDGRVFGTCLARRRNKVSRITDRRTELTTFRKISPLNQWQLSSCWSEFWTPNPRDPEGGARNGDTVFKKFPARAGNETVSPKGETVVKREIRSWGSRRKKWWFFLVEKSLISNVLPKILIFWSVISPKRKRGHSFIRKETGEPKIRRYNLVYLCFHSRYRFEKNRKSDQKIGKSKISVSSNFSIFDLIEPIRGPISPR